MAHEPGKVWVIEDPGRLVGALLAGGWRVIGPRVRDGAVVYEPLEGAEDLPRGMVDEQEGGRYRLREGRPGSWFDYVVGPHSWKRWLFPARRRLWSATRTADGFELEPEREEWPPTAFFGVRPCELAAMDVQDRVFQGGDFADPCYARRRAETLVVAVQCARSAATCFCASMGTGPRAESGFDLALTELGEPGDEAFLIEVGSGRGQAVLASLEARPAEPRHLAAAEEARRTAVDGQARRMVEDAPSALRDLEHPRWDEVAQRCLACANCTLACPTCFCSDVEDVTDLTGEHAERWRSWDSCYGLEFSSVHGGAVRRSIRSRYRQWLTHKLSTWHEQFGTSGCVGCGRCITWCPVGIDLTEEAAAIAAGRPDPEG